MAEPPSPGQPAAADSQDAGGAGPVVAASISLPKGGGALRGLGEKFTASPSTGTASLSLPVPASPGRSGFGPQLSLSYDSGAGNGPCGLGWSLSLPSITRKTDKGLPRYADEPESDVFILSGAEDLVPVQAERDGRWLADQADRMVGGVEYRVARYRPRVEGPFARIERWTDHAGTSHWRSISRAGVCTWYGRTPESRIADPANPGHVFSWLICESHDDRGNAIVYEYKAEDSAGVDLSAAHERRRRAADRSANRYLKRIRYGNRVPLRVPHQPPAGVGDPADWMFELVLDYGEHDAQVPAPAESRPWQCRPDPFSSYRAGFEIRTYRLCQRLLMFHHFPDEPAIGPSCLVSSTNLTYRAGPVASFLTAVAKRGYRRAAGGRVHSAAWPALELEYTRAQPGQTVRELDRVSLQNLPAGPGGPGYRWVDLDGEGLTGILTEQAQAWFYKRNLGAGRFGPVERLTTTPAMPRLSDDGAQLTDLDGDGRVELVALAGPMPGFSGRSADGGWDPFRPFTALPAISFTDPSLRLVDVSGDGRPDILVTDDRVFTYYLSRGTQGFGPASVATAPGTAGRSELVFADETQSIFLADLSGDGLTDIVRVRNGEICYWPSLGYGRFGARVTMDDSPWFDPPDLFDQRRIRLGDVDGSGGADIVYLGRDATRVYANMSGNRWSQARQLPALPHVDQLSSVALVDLLGSGTACLVWSSPLPGDARLPVRYIDLTGGVKPHLLASIRNNLGSETLLSYAPSTRFYVADRAAGQPWVTRLPFPVQVLEQVEHLDRIGHGRFVSRYAYHHGFYDDVEREFRGFGMVEQWDTEQLEPLGGPSAGFAADADGQSQAPPVRTKTWFHTGFFAGRDRISRHFEREYYHEPGADRSALLDDTVLPHWLSDQDAREACRALKGSILRIETYALDGTAAQDRPYSASERNYTVVRLQPAGQHEHGVFFTHARETMDRSYERLVYLVDGESVADPRIAHQATLAVDDYGNVLETVGIGYGRRHPSGDPALTRADHAVQARSRATYHQHRFTNAVLEPDSYRAPLPCADTTFELLLGGERGVLPFGTLVRLVAEAAEPGRQLPFGDRTVPGGGGAGATGPYRRMVSDRRIAYRRDDLTGALPPGRLEPLALPYQSYRLAFTDGLPAAVYGDRIAEGDLAADGGYVRLPAEPGWWIPSGQVFYAPGPGDASDELAAARGHFFVPRRFVDPFGGTTSVDFDTYDLLPVSTRDPAGNQVTAGERDEHGTVRPANDYRVLQPVLVCDANRNRSAVAFDALGMVAGTAVMGKPGERAGDSLDGFEPDLDGEVIARHTRDPARDPLSLLGLATTRMVYDVFAFQRTAGQASPDAPFVYSIVRETHASDLAPGEHSRVRLSFSYSDGFGREIQQKVRAEPGPLVPGGPTAELRWVASGWTVFDTKGRPVRQYEPFFTAHHRAEIGHVTGVATTTFYDPLGRVIGTLHANHAWEKISFDPWHQLSWDANDTVLIDPGADADLGDYFRRLPAADYLPTWYEARAAGDLGAREHRAAELTARHAATPTASYLDALGRAFLSVFTNRVFTNRTGSGKDEYLTSRSVLDISGKPVQVSDVAGRVVERYEYDVAGRRIHESSMEAGERWLLHDASDRIVRSWDSRGHAVRSTYDAMRRPADVWVRTGQDPEILAGRTVYGESAPDAERRNLRGAVHVVLDGAGQVTNERYDFKQNLLEAARQFALTYRSTPDWSAAPGLEDEVYASRTSFDALNRPTQLVAPHPRARSAERAVVIQQAYNLAGLTDRVDAWTELDAPPPGLLDAGSADLHAVTGVEYNAHGLREVISYGNGTRTSYGYDPLTFRLRSLRTVRGQTALQDLTYTQDPSGNITDIRDRAQQTVFFRNRQVEPTAEYVYDAVYRLIEASGREHLSAGRPAPPGGGAAPWYALPGPEDGTALGRYVERFRYDLAGNLTQQRHRSQAPGQAGWSRGYHFEEPSQLEPGQLSNRLSATTTGGPAPGNRESYAYDAHGNMIALPHLPGLSWDYQDRLQASTAQVAATSVAETTYYAYDSAGVRVRKVTHRGRRVHERRYLGGFEIERRYAGDGDTVDVERETVHLTDDKQRVALLERRTLGTDEGAGRLTRFQYGNHLGSAVLELDLHSRVITYEEFYPYGGSAYRAARRRTQTPKRFRFCGKELDSETGLYYFGQRYYAPWLGRWISADPAGLADGPNVYLYVRDDPVGRVDPAGLDSAPHPLEEQAQASLPEVHGTPAEEAAQASLLDPYPDASSSAAPPPPPPASPPPTATGHIIVPPPPVSPPDTTLYVAPGFAWTQYSAAVDGALDSDNPWWARGVLGALAILAAPLAGVEEYIARPILNVPYTVENAGTGIGEHSARAYLWAQQGEYGEATVDGLHAVTSFSSGFVAAGTVAVPVAGALESRLARVPLVEPPPPTTTALATSWQQQEQLVSQRLAAQNPGATIGQQVTLDVTGPGSQTVTIRIDNLVPTNGRFQLVDAKFSAVTDLSNPAASLRGTVTGNQRTVYGWISNGQPVTVIPRGANAVSAGLTPGVPIAVEPTVQIHVNGPAGIVVRNY